MSKDLTLDIREYQRDDWPRLCAIHDAARQNELKLAGLPQAFLPLAVAAAREGLFDYDLRVAQLGGEVAGFVAYLPDELGWLYVDPLMARRGVGRALTRYVLDNTRKRPLSVEVLGGNFPARRLYESCGFCFIESLNGQMPGNELFAVSADVLMHM